MLLLLQATIPPTLTTTAASGNAVSRNWASVQLNIIMLPVGIGLLVIVSGTACICQCLRKRRIKQLKKELLKQRRIALKNVQNKHPNRHFSFSSKQSTAIVSPSHSLERERTISTVSRSSSKFKKERRKRQQKLKGDLVRNGSHLDSKNVSYTRKNTFEFSQSDQVRPATAIPAPLNQSNGGRTYRYVHSVSAGRPSTSPCSNNSMNRRYYGYYEKKSVTTSMQQSDVRSSKDRRKWEIPTVTSLEYDKKGSLRLPPLSELRLAKTA